MQFGAVALVLAEAILGKTGAEVTHHSVARDLGDDTGGGDAQADAIALHDGGLGKGEWGNGQAVDEDVFGRAGQEFDGGAHGFVGSAQDIDLIDLVMIDHADSPRDLLVGNQLCVDLLSQVWRELLGVLEFAVPELLGKNHGRGHDWSG